MLETVLAYLNNWFPVEIHSGTFTVENGRIDLPFLKNGQYFRVIGSVFNDGLHKYGETCMAQEAFDGAVWALAIPVALQSLADEIQAWNVKNAPTAYSSESFAGYSYTKATNGNGKQLTWKDAFSAQLSPYKKLRDSGNVVPNGAGTPPFPTRDFWR